MAEKNKVKVKIANMELILLAEETPSYTLSVAEEVDKKINELLEKNPQISVSAAAVLVALEYCDEAKKAKQSSDNLRAKISEYSEEISRLKKR